MALRDHEKRTLEEIERQMVDDEPALAAALSGMRTSASASSRTGWLVAAMLAAYVSGLLVCFAGAATSSVLLMVLGSAVTVNLPIGVALWMRRDRQ
jgi:hypothetical protein